MLLAAVRRLATRERDLGRDTASLSLLRHAVRRLVGALGRVEVGADRRLHRLRGALELLERADQVDPASVVEVRAGGVESAHPVSHDGGIQTGDRLEHVFDFTLEWWYWQGPHARLWRTGCRIFSRSATEAPLS